MRVGEVLRPNRGIIISTMLGALALNIETAILNMPIYYTFGELSVLTLNAARLLRSPLEQAQQRPEDIDNQH
jgi:hypothetical protein